MVKNLQKIIIYLAFSLLIFWSGVQIGKKNITLQNSLKAPLTILNKRTPENKNVDFSLFWNVWERLEQYFVDKEKIDPEKMLYGAISGMVASLGDPYTVFLDPKQNKESKEDLSGQFEGVGIQLGLKDKNIVVIAPLKDTPADIAGIKEGDFIVKVDGKETTGWTLPEAVAKIRGQKGSKVTLTIFREGSIKPKDIPLVRATIYVKSVEMKITNTETATKSASGKNQISQAPESVKDKTIVHLVLSRFGDDTASEWDKSVSQISRDYQDKNTKGLILDLRNNPGGYLSGAVYIASEFLSSGVVVKQEHTDGKTDTYSVSRTGKLLEIPLVILINKGSASASEIVAGALRDYKRATLVGQKTFGKGSIQEAQELPGGAGIHITTAKWLLPKGEWINGKGIEADVKIEQDEKKPNRDLQLEKAIEILNNQITKF